MRHDAIPGRRLSFGAPLFEPTHSSDQVAEALRGHLPQDELAEMARQLTKAVRRRNRARKDSTHLSNLLALVTRASRPPAYTGDVEWFTQPVGGDPLEVLLMSGEREGDKVTRVPAGASFVVPELDAQISPLYCRPAGTEGPDSIRRESVRPGVVIRTMGLAPSTFRLFQPATAIDEAPC